MMIFTPETPQDVIENKLKKYETQLIDMKDIFADHEFNVRGRIDRMTCVGLANEIAKVGLQQPIVLRPYSRKAGFKYQIVAGHRRYTAFQINNATHIPAYVRTDLTNDYAAAALNLSENVQREQLNMMMEARRINYFLAGGFSVRETAKMIGQAPGWVETRKRIMELPSYVHDEVAKEVIKQSHIQKLYEARGDEQKLLELVREIKLRAEKGNREVEVKEPPTYKELDEERKPKQGEISDMRMLIYGLITSKCDLPEYFPHRLLSWIMGDISRIDMYDSLKIECDRMGLAFKLPAEITAILEAKQ